MNYVVILWEKPCVGFRRSFLGKKENHGKPMVAQERCRGVGSP